ncbi:hypothetical protein DCAR_0520368 [Daucus carota subsp. sativus]|uniref:PB1 domain-containing protein n=1 Tax=Daucus carota subsp. sativus TaxID=79200 RepID=A0AAF0X3Y6_DAUCS|nr:hypothetical protein DCAR_0520368 [Daucus carota subsp. sativus]
MVKQWGKNKKKTKKSQGEETSDLNLKLSRISEINTKAYDEDTKVFILISQELKDEGNKFFQNGDLEGAIFNYEKALKLLPQNHIDVSYLHTNMAACYMQMGLSEYPLAIHECNLALQVTPKYTKALLKRARCYEALNELQYAQADVDAVLKMEPNNLMATEISNRLKSNFEKKYLKAIDLETDPASDYLETRSSMHLTSPKEKPQMKSDEVKEQLDNHFKEKGGYRKAVEELEENRTQDKFVMEEVVQVMIKEKKAEDELVEDENKTEERQKENSNKDKLVLVNKAGNGNEEKNIKDKLVVQETKSNVNEEKPERKVKLVYGEDIRWAQVPIVCSILTLRDIIRDRFPGSKAVLVKYKDHEGDLVTITTDEELKWAEAAAEQGSLRLYVMDVSPEHDPLFEKVKKNEEVYMHHKNHKDFTDNGYIAIGNNARGRQSCIDDWIVQFSELFKNYVGFSCDAYLDLHEFGMKVYAEAMEETVTSEEAQGIFNTASEKFQEMASLALFNWGNVHMSRARKRVYFTGEDSNESAFVQVKNAYNWAQDEFLNAGKRYEEALRIKPDFYEGVLALGLQQFERAKLSWYYAVAKNDDLDKWSSTDVIQLYNCAEENMEKGMQMFEVLERERLDELSKEKNLSISDGLIEDIRMDEAAELSAHMRSQINILWGTMLYERSNMEYKLGLPVWQESLEVAVEKFELSGASPTDVAVVIKNHSSNSTALEGLGFNIDEIIQAWKEMHEAKKWQSGIRSFRLEPLLRRRALNLYHVLER